MATMQVRITEMHLRVFRIQSQKKRLATELVTCTKLRWLPGEMSLEAEQRSHRGEAWFHGGMPGAKQS